MRILVLTLLIMPIIGFSQEDESVNQRSRTFMGFGIEGAFNLLDEPTLSFSEYKSVVNAPDFFLHSPNAELIASNKIFTRNGVKARFIFKGPEHQNLGAFKQSRFVVGGLFNAGNNYTFEFHEQIKVRADTITMTSSSGATEILYRDSVFYHSTEYSARSSNIGIFGEYLIYTGEGVPSIVTGIGISAEVTMIYQADVKQNVSVSTALFDDSGILKYTPVIYNPANDTYLYGDVNDVYDTEVRQSIKTAYFIRPYIPVRLETALSNRPKLNNFTVDINAKIGTEIQFNPGASVNARMFYSLGLGLNYYL